MMENESIINVIMEDNTTINFKPCVRAKLLEINTNLKNNKDLLKESVRKVYLILLSLA